MTRTGDRLLAVVAAILLTCGLVACTAHAHPGAGRSVSITPSPSVQSKTVHVIAAIGAVVRVAGASLAVPARSLDRDADVQLSVGGQPPAGAPAMYRAAGLAVHGDLGGARLVHGATLTLPLSTPAVGIAGAGYLDESANTWLPRRATVNSVTHLLTLSVPHLSWYQPWTWDLGAVKSRLEQFFGKLVGYGVTLRTDPPTCLAAPVGVTATVTGGRAGDPSLDGCVEDAGGDNIRLRLVNNRPYGMAVTPPQGSTLEKVSRGGLLAAMYQNKSLTDVGGDYLPAGGEGDYVLPQSGPTVSAAGAWSWKTYTLDAAVGMLLTIAGSRAPPADAAAAAKAGAAATKLSPAELASVGQCLGDQIFSDPPGSVTDAIRADLGCLGNLDDVWLAPLALVQGLITDLAGALDAGEDLSVGSAGTVTVVRPLAPPVLGAQWATYQTGFGTVAPHAVFNGGDPTGELSITSWDSWGGPTALAHGSAEYLAPGQEVAAGTSEPATAEAFDLGTCKGKRAYLRLAWWFPQHGQTFDPATNNEAFYNICTGGAA